MRAVLADARAQPVLNYVRNPQQVQGGAVIEALARFSGVRSYRTQTWAPDAPSTSVRFTTPTERSVSADIGSNFDTVVGATGDAFAYPVTPGEWVSLSLWATSSSMAGMRIGTRFHDGASWLAPGTLLSDLPAGQRISRLLQAPAGAAYVSFRIQSQDNMPVGGWIEYTGLQIDRSPVLRPYVDGSTGRWLGTPNASPSVAYPRY